NVRKKQSEYGLQLNEKQKLKFIYGVLEKQFYNYYLVAEKKPGVTGENLLQLLEERLDNVVYRLGYANTRREARQLIGHGHFTVNGQKVDIPSYLIKVGDEIAIKEKSRASEKFKAVMETNSKWMVPKWLSKDAENFKGTVLALPDRGEIDYDVQETLVVELYSK
ncbi:MAG: 30S ribosomal protein S4, partial [Oscillospiraceae bacterium]